jgi:hypothetical protein
VATNYIGNENSFNFEITSWKFDEDPRAVSPVLMIFRDFLINYSSNPIEFPLVRLIADSLTKSR